MDRPSTANISQAIKSKIQEINAEILALTETSELIDLSSDYFSIKSQEFPHYQDAPWITIWSRWPITESITTFNPYRTACCLIDSPFGQLIVYGTIIPYHMAGVSGNRYPEKGKKVWQMHLEDILAQTEDWKKIMSNYPGIPLVIAGDFNQTRDNIPMGYGTGQARKLLTQKLLDNGLVCITESDFGFSGYLTPDPKKQKIRRNIDHICISRSPSLEMDYQVGAWDHFTDDGFFMSDHNGVYVDLSKEMT